MICSILTYVLIAGLQPIVPNLIILRMALGTAATSKTEGTAVAFNLSAVRLQKSQGQSQMSGTTAANPSFATSHSSIPGPGGDGVWTSEVKSTQPRSVTDQDSLV